MNGPHYFDDRPCLLLKYQFQYCTFAPKPLNNIHQVSLLNVLKRIFYKQLYKLVAMYGQLCYRTIYVYIKPNTGQKINTFLFFLPSPMMTGWQKEKGHFYLHKSAVAWHSISVPVLHSLHTSAYKRLCSLLGVYIHSSQEVDTYWLVSSREQEGGLRWVYLASQYEILKKISRVCG